MSSSEPTASRFCVLHDSDTDMGTLMLRRRWSPALERDVFEMTLDGKLMMSSAVTVSEQALARHALALLPDRPLRVLIGGLGFGFTALAVLADARVGELTIIERLGPVIAWHRSGLLPWSGELTADPRVEIVEGDFFAAVVGDVPVHRETDPIFAAQRAFSPNDPPFPPRKWDCPLRVERRKLPAPPCERLPGDVAPGARYDAILIDIDDSPSLLWHDRHAAFYEPRSLAALHRNLQPGGVLALWCATHPAEPFIKTVKTVFATVLLVEVPFENPCVRQSVTDYLVLATARA